MVGKLGKKEQTSKSCQPRLTLVSVSASSSHSFDATLLGAAKSIDYLWEKRSFNGRGGEICAEACTAEAQPTHLLLGVAVGNR